VFQHFRVQKVWRLDESEVAKSEVANGFQPLIAREAHGNGLRDSKIGSLEVCERET
jgi:hypothetical protein